MTVGDVFPRRNLPGEAEEWGRTLETRAVNAESQLSILSQELQGQNRNTASSLAVIAQQLDAIEQAQAELRSVQDALTEQVEFLQTQTVGDQRLSTSGGSRSGASGYNYETYDNTYDCVLNVTTGSSGKLLISTGGTMTSAGGAVGIGFEIAGGALPTTSNSAVAGSDGVVGASRTVLATLTPNSSYTIYTRRWWNAAIAVQWVDCNLTVTRLA